MNSLVRIILPLILALVSSSVTAPAQQAATPGSKANPAPTPIPLAEVPSQAQAALDSVQETEADVSRDQSSVDSIARTFNDSKDEIDARIGEDKRLLVTSPSLDVLYPLKRFWQSFDVRLLVSARQLTAYATSLEEQLARLDKLDKTWQATLQTTKQPDTPTPVLQHVQSIIDSVERTRQATASGQARVLALQSRVSEQQARVRRALSSIEQAEIQALQHIFVRDSSPIWNLQTSLSTEWEKYSSESFSLQVKASAKFVKRLPFTFLIHALFILLMATALYWMRRRVRKLAEEKPDLQRALPILDVPVSTAFALSMLLVPTIYAQAPRLILAIMAIVALLPAVVVLRRLLLRDTYPILNGIVILFIIGELRLLAASLPLLARFIFLGQLLSAILYLSGPSQLVSTDRGA